MFTTEEYEMDLTTSDTEIAHVNFTTVQSDNMMMTLSPTSDVLQYEAFLTRNPTMAIPYLIAVSMSLTVGTFGNIVLIGAILFHRKIRTAGYELVINMAVADLCVTAVADPMCALGVIHGKKWFDERPTLCVGIASMCLGACFCAFLSLGALTINRLVFIFKREHYNTLCTRGSTLCACFFAWALSFAFELPNFFGWGGHYYDEKNMQCMWDRTADTSYTLFVAICLILMPLGLMVLAYVGIFVKIYRAKLSMSSYTDQSKQKSPMKEAIQSCRSIIAIVIAFIVCWMPYAVVICIDAADKLPFWVHIWVTFLAHAHSTLNFFIYGITNPHFRDGYRKFLRIGCSCNLNVKESIKGKNNGSGEDCNDSHFKRNPLAYLFDSTQTDSIKTNDSTKNTSESP